eukprot:GHUV01009768.1.p1 GENE.GHUV01009768.1~~GHUV01009768.1.p1  ORF type:complete len:387 (+),score=74.62 GHUV01009768.1:293-1453(+)
MALRRAFGLLTLFALLIRPLSATCDMAASEASGSSDSSSTRIAIVKILDNTSGMEAVDQSVSIERFEKLLQDPGQVDCPLLKRLGYPVILVSTTPGKKCIPVVQYPPVYNNKHNNRMATTAASRTTTGLAMGCVIGDVYALREDGKDLTKAEWWELWDILMSLMDEYGEGPGRVTDKLRQSYKLRLRHAMEQQGLLKPRGAGSGYHCLECGKEETDDQKLLKCATCKTARYCSKECQKAHWRNGHKQVCKAPEETSEATKVEELLQTAVLQPEQIIQTNAPIPALPRNMPDNLAAMGRILPPDDLAIVVYNKHVMRKKSERICPKCKTHYRLLAQPDPEDRAAKEQQLSGICSYACFRQMSAGEPHGGPEWYGQDAEQPEGVVFKF